MSVAQASDTRRPSIPSRQTSAWSFGPEVRAAASRAANPAGAARCASGPPRPPSAGSPPLPGWPAAGGAAARRGHLGTTGRRRWRRCGRRSARRRGRCPRRTARLGVERRPAQRRRRSTGQPRQFVVRRGSVRRSSVRRSSLRDRPGKPLGGRGTWYAGEVRRPRDQRLSVGRRTVPSRGCVEGSPAARRSTIAARSAGVCAVDMRIPASSSAKTQPAARSAVTMPDCGHGDGPADMRASPYAKELWSAPIRWRTAVSDSAPADRSVTLTAAAAAAPGVPRVATIMVSGEPSAAALVGVNRPTKTTDQRVGGSRTGRAVHRAIDGARSDDRGLPASDQSWNLALHALSGVRQVARAAVDG